MEAKYNKNKKRKSNNKLNSVVFYFVRRLMKKLKSSSHIRNTTSIHNSNKTKCLKQKDNDVLDINQVKPDVKSGQNLDILATLSHLEKLNTKIDALENKIAHQHSLLHQNLQVFQEDQAKISDLILNALPINSHNIKNNNNNNNNKNNNNNDNNNNNNNNNNNHNSNQAKSRRKKTKDGLDIFIKNNKKKKK